MWSELARSLATSTILPFSVSDYGTDIQLNLEDTISKYESILLSDGIKYFTGNCEF